MNTNIVNSMDEMLKQELTKFLQTANTAITDGYGVAKIGAVKSAEFLQGQIPDIINQFLWWQGIKSFCFWALGIVPFYFAIRYWRKSWQHTCEEDENPPIILLNVLLLFISFVFFIGASDWIKIWICPKLYILQYIMDLAK
jgi:hypothetical protein